MTTAESEVADVLMTVPARQTAFAWLNAFLATSSDETRPALFKTLSLEFFDNGIQFIGCDGTVLFRSWSSTEGDGWPDISEAPRRSIVVMDPEGFGLGFVKLLLHVTNDKERAYEQLTMNTAPNDESATLALGQEFMTERLILRACGQRLDLMLFDGPYPDWRRVRLGVEAVERVDSLTVSTRNLGLIGRLKAVDAVDMEFYGDKKHIAFTAKGESEVRGLLMPMMRAPKKVEE